MNPQLVAELNWVVDFGGAGEGVGAED